MARYPTKPYCLFLPNETLELSRNIFVAPGRKSLNNSRTSPPGPLGPGMYDCKA